MVEEKFKVLTFNCWAVFFPSSTVRKEDRLNAIALKLSYGDFDIILLQEIWLDADYDKLRCLLNDKYPYSNYFYCNLIGTGMCIFCKWPMDCVFTHPFTANGYPHLIHQADYYCGKGIGLARVTSKEGFRINLYVTHLIARYELNRTLDKYNGHRISQLIEVMEFIRMTSTGSDAIIITGDFNLESDTSAIELFRTSLKLSDAWLNNAIVEKNPNIASLELDGCTCDRADNPYRNQLWTSEYGNGERLDYIFYRSGPSVIDSLYIPSYAKLVCDSCWLDMRKVPDDPHGLHYSDHEGVAASFTITRLCNPKGQSISTDEVNKLRDLLLDADKQLTRGLNQCLHGRVLHLSWAGIVVLLLLILIIFIDPTYWLTSILKSLLQVVLGAILFSLIWGSLIGRTIEKSGLQNAKQCISTLSSRLDSPTNDFTVIK
ncbi:unnamed protein product [Heterobilharzia americana]|nr:unnamed protein product [Heterobilharzia americana]CAH8667494.1 unnamed protein product [Heterobilharzia americana]